MARRTALKAWDKRLLERIRRGKWSAEDLQWVLTHLDQSTPTLVVQAIHSKLIEVESQSASYDPGNPLSTTEILGDIS
jgi:hypothetical protein